VTERPEKRAVNSLKAMRLPEATVTVVGTAISFRRVDITAHDSSAAGAVARPPLNPSCSALTPLLLRGPGSACCPGVLP
jgi:hypothetical protein